MLLSLTLTRSSSQEISGLRSSIAGIPDTRGLREVSAEKMRQRRPERIVEYAIRGMLPEDQTGRAMFRKSKIYTAGTHPHAAQQPEPLAFSA